jgi:toxin CptA
MPTSTAWSSTSAICQLDWRPSRALTAGLHVLGLLAGLSTLASEMPRALAWAMAMLAMAYAGWLARRYRRLAPRRLAWLAGRPPELDGTALQQATLEWRGPLAFLRWRDAEDRARRLAWWPDTLPRAARRELRLVAEVAPHGPSAPAMAP